MTKKSSTSKLPYYNNADFTPIFIDDTADIKKNITHCINNFSFYNEDSNIVTHTIVENKIHVANFIFTTCGSICPTMTKYMKVVSDSLLHYNNIIFLSYSVTPWIDKPSVLKKYKKKYNIENKNWYFLTGNKNEIYKLARQSYFAEQEIGLQKEKNDFLHTEYFILVDTHKRIRGIYNGTLILEMKHLLNDIKELKKENVDEH